MYACNVLANHTMLTNLLEQPQGSPLTMTGNQLTVPIHPFEILTIPGRLSEGGAVDSLTIIPA